MAAETEQIFQIYLFPKWYLSTDELINSVDFVHEEYIFVKNQLYTSYEIYTGNLLH